MKKIVSLLLVLLLTLACFTACGTEPGSADATKEPEATTEPTQAPDAPGLTITGWTSLDGLNVGFQAGTTAEDKVTELNETGTVKCATKSNESVVNCFKMLENGEIDAVVCDDGVAKIYYTKNPDKFNIAWTQTESPEEFGIALAKEGSAELKTAVNEALAELKAEGFLDALYNKWFGDGADVTMPTEKTVECKATLLTEGTLTSGAEFSYPPFEDTDEGGNYVGYDVDLTTAIATKLGLKIQYVNHGFDTIFASLGTEYDIVASAVTISDERRDSMDFSDPYIDNYLAIVTAK